VGAEQIINLGLGVLVLVLVVLAQWAEQRDVRRLVRGNVWSALRSRVRAAGTELGLEFTDGRREEGCHLRGRVSGVETSVTCEHRKGDLFGTSVSVRPHPPLEEIQLLPSRWRNERPEIEGAVPAMTADVETGDPLFDRLFDVGGRASLARALLTHPVRASLTKLARHAAVYLVGGRLTWDVLGPPWPEESVTTLVRDVLAAVQAFPQVGDVPRALANLAAHDPVPGVRAHCLTTLLEDYPDRHGTGEALEAGLRDSSDWVRVVAATALGSGGMEVLREIAKSGDSSQAAAARAVTVLGRRLSTPETLAILDASLACKRLGVAVAAIETLGHLDDDQARARLRTLLGGDNEELASVAAGALGTAGRGEAERILLGELGLRSRPVQLAIIDALSKVGGAATVARLNALLEPVGVDQELAKSVQQAIAAIGARLPNTLGGRLSLAKGPEGELSLAADHRSGQVSLARRKDAEE